MDKPSPAGGDRYSVVVVGAGPAGSSLAIRMAIAGHRVALIEREFFPREKLCGEFISPECFRHFEELGVRTDLASRGGTRILETSFFSRSGMKVTVPTTWFGSDEFALGLSRAEMDHRLLLRARHLGVDIFEGHRVIKTEMDREAIVSISTRTSRGGGKTFSSDIFVDATGRSAVISKLAVKASSTAGALTQQKPDFVGLKTHLRGASISDKVCEIYFFDGGYGGLNVIEGEKANLCCLVRAESAKGKIGNPNQLLDLVRKQNLRAGETLEFAEPVGEWIGVSVPDFGEKPGNRIENLFAVGDAAAFIDPFTGSGILMGLESSEVLSISIGRHPDDHVAIAKCYGELRDRSFGRRFRVSRILRKAAFAPRLAAAAIFLAGQSSFLRGMIARTTRQAGPGLRITT